MELDNVTELHRGEMHCSENVSVEINRPKKVLHFSDGVMDEFDDSDDDDAVKRPEKNESMAVIESELQWGPWIFHKATKAGTTFLSGCDYVGGSLASMLGITTPKYQSEIAEFKRTQAEKERIEREKAESASWMEKEDIGDVITNDVAAGDQKDKF